MESTLEMTIHERVAEIARPPAGGSLAVENSQRLVADLGFSSMDIAQLVATLEIELGLDPFSEEVSITSVRTVGDLCDAYRSCRRPV